MGIDKHKICTGGVSGGCQIAFGSARQLLKTNDQHMIKAMILETPMISNIAGRLPKE